MLNLQDASIAYAKSAKRILGNDASFLKENQNVIPVFVSLLFQSVEISLKHLGIESKLFTKEESRDKKLTKNGHGVKEIADLVNNRLGANKNYPVVMALTAKLNNTLTSEILNKMIFSKEFAPTRKSYQNRNLGYAQLSPGSLQLLNGLKPWADAVEEAANNLPTAVKVVSDWKKSGTKSKAFAIWYEG
jgi:hypothetical protein